MDPIVEGLLKDVALLKQKLENFNKPEVPLGLSLISYQNLTGSVASVTFSAIPQTFRHLQIIWQARTDNAAESDNIQQRFNGDSGANYDRQRFLANDTTLSGAVARAGTSDQIGPCEGANARASNFSPGCTYIFGYARTDAEKWTMSHSAQFGDVSADADLQIQFRAGRWRSTAAITSIVLLPVTGTNFVSGSRFDLYGIK